MRLPSLPRQLGTAARSGWSAPAPGKVLLTACRFSVQAGLGYSASLPIIAPDPSLQRH